MLTKRITRSLVVLSIGAFAITGFATQGNAWEQSDATKIIDYESHNDSTDLNKGIYDDWTDQPVGWQVGEGWPYTYNFYHRYTTSNGGKQQRHGVAAWLWKIPKTGWYDIRTNFKRTENRTTAAQYYVYANVTISDIVKNATGDAIVHKVVDQHGPNDEAGAWYYAEFGAICLQEGDISALVLDSRDTDRSSSADAAFWTFLGERYNSQDCNTSAVTVAPQTLLLKK